MANNNFVTNTSVFTPFTYEKIAAPLMQQTQMQIALEDSYNQLGTNASAIASLLNPTNDKRAFAIYQNYMNELSNQAESLAKQGLNSKSRSALSKLNARYGTDIMPIQKAYENRAAEIKRYNELKGKNGTMFANFNPSTLSVDDYMSNPNLSFSSVNGSDLTKQVADQLEPFAKILRDYYTTGKLDNYTNTWLEKRGLSIQDIQEALANPYESGIIQNIINGVIATSGAMSWGDPDSAIAARLYASQGVWKGLGEDKVHTFDDYGSRAALQDFYATRRMMTRAAMSGSDSGTIGNTSASPWRTHRTVAAGNKKGYDSRDDISALDNMMKGNLPIDTNAIKSMAERYNMNIADIIDNEGRFIKTGTDELYNKMGKQSYMNTEFELNMTDYDRMSEIISNALKIRISRGVDTGLREYDGNRLKDKYAKYKDIQEYINKDATLTYLPNIGFFIVGQNSDGDVKRFKIDEDVLSGHRLKVGDREEDLQNYLKRIDQLYKLSVSEYNFDEADAILDALGNNLYYIFNTSRPVQSNTTDKIK